ncbi:signal peptidase I [Microcoleus sp. FACHB-1515]|uniref:signal peptidase I n=1 Tax=Cyanophyceae TaxID=3028117 RepID=UPI00168920B0|nr:signal peptidase I [Microcoleus sp. FACHB-1515]MBD2088671.1 signal peptidase I [Microcoleus sp. FACHB-1515]
MQPDFSSNIVSGNALADGASRRGWFVGHFIDAHPARQTADVEVKWAAHAAGEQRSEWSTNRTATTLSILIHGRFRLYFLDPEGLPGRTREILLTQAGDYVLWLPGVPHSWRVEEAATVLTVRFPSAPGDTMK